MFLTPEELMMGASASYEVEIPNEILYPKINDKTEDSPVVSKKVKLKPLTVKDVQLIAKAAA